MCKKQLSTHILPPVSPEETIAVMKVREMLLKAELLKGQWVHVSSVETDF